MCSSGNARDKHHNANETDVIGSLAIEVEKNTGLENHLSLILFCDH